MKSLRTSLTFVVATVLTIGLSPGALSAQEPLTVADRLEIQELYARYAHTFDGQDAEGWADTFTEDGTNGRATGRTALIEYARSRFPVYQGNVRHWNNQLILTPTAGGAEGQVYLILWDVGTQPPTILSMGMYHDELVKTPAGWRFKSRRGGGRPGGGSDGR